MASFSVPPAGENGRSLRTAHTSLGGPSSERPRIDSLRQLNAMGNIDQSVRRNSTHVPTRTLPPLVVSQETRSRMSEGNKYDYRVNSRSIASLRPSRGSISSVSDLRDSHQIRPSSPAISVGFEYAEVDSATFAYDPLDFALRPSAVGEIHSDMFSTRNSDCNVANINRNSLVFKNKELRQSIGLESKAERDSTFSHKIPDDEDEEGGFINNFASKVTLRAKIRNKILCVALVLLALALSFLIVGTTIRNTLRHESTLDQQNGSEDDTGQNSGGEDGQDADDDSESQQDGRWYCETHTSSNIFTLEACPQTYQRQGLTSQSAPPTAMEMDLALYGFNSPHFSTAQSSLSSSNDVALLGLTTSLSSLTCEQKQSIRVTCCKRSAGLICMGDEILGSSSCNKTSKPTACEQHAEENDSSSSMEDQNGQANGKLNSEENHTDNTTALYKWYCTNPLAEIIDYADSEDYDQDIEEDLNPYLRRYCDVEAYACPSQRVILQPNSTAASQPKGESTGLNATTNAEIKRVRQFKCCPQDVGEICADGEEVNDIGLCPEVDRPVECEISEDKDSSSDSSSSGSAGDDDSDVESGSQSGSDEGTSTSSSNENNEDSSLEVINEEECTLPAPNGENHLLYIPAWDGTGPGHKGSNNRGFAMNPHGIGCISGNHCPYACNAPYIPSSQGYTNAECPPGTEGCNMVYQEQSSKHGLLCDKGKVKLDPNKPSQLCVMGLNSIVLENRIETASITACQTVYPGSEIPQIPVTAPANGGRHNLASFPISYWYGVHNHYYINLPGVSATKACQWNDDPNSLNLGGVDFFPYTVGGGAVHSTRAQHNLDFVSNYDQDKAGLPGYGIRVQNCVGEVCGDVLCEALYRKPVQSNRAYQVWKRYNTNYANEGLLPGCVMPAVDLNRGEYTKFTTYSINADGTCRGSGCTPEVDFDACTKVLSEKTAAYGTGLQPARYACI